VAVHVDDLAIAMKDPQAFVDMLKNEHNFEPKSTTSMPFHLIHDFFQDDDGTLCMAPRKHVDKMIMNCERMFGEKPKMNIYSPLEKGDYPEMDTIKLLELEDMTKCQSIIGSLQWAVSLGRLDIATAIMTLVSAFRALPRVGHLDRAK
jgi:hypothetical protein